MNSEVLFASAPAVQSSKMKLARKAERGLPPIGANINEKGGDRRDICETLFKEGNVQSFVDFFYLTHRPEPCIETLQIEKEIQVPGVEMIFIQNKLKIAENERRKGEARAVYAAYCELAEYFQTKSGDANTSIYFYEKCLEMAKNTGDFRGEMAALHDLGLAFSLLEENATASKYLEKQLQMAQDLDDQKEIQKALRQLMDVYRKAAQEEKKYTTKISLLTKALNAARSAGDETDEARAALLLGETLLSDKIAFSQSEEFTLSTLETADQIYKRLSDTQGEGRTCAALGQLWLQSHQNSPNQLLKAQDYLQRSLDIAIANDDLKAQASACQNLAELYSRQSNAKQAVTLLERNFQIAKQLLANGQTDSTVLDKARVLLGVAIGKAKINDYFRLLTSNSPQDLSTLLAWKLARVPLPEASQATTEHEPHE